jgi:hypothetical protein
MMNNLNWKYYYKLVYGQKAETNLLYTPTVNLEGTIMCMHYCIDRDYRNNTPDKLTKELVEWFFQREAKFLTDLQHLNCTPEVYEVDYKNKKIFIEWNKETFSQIVNDPARSIDKEVPDWKLQLKEIFKEFHNARHYKLSLYPHCFFIDKNKQIKTIDYYSVVPYEQQYIERKIIEGIIGPIGEYRFDISTNNGLLDFKKFHEITINYHLDNYWDVNPFKEIFLENNR